MTSLTPSSSNQTAEIQTAIDHVHAQGGGTVSLLPGLHLSGTLHLKSGLTLEILPGAVLKGIEDPNAFEALSSSIPSRMDTVAWKAFLYADGQENIRICGGGTLDGSGDADCFQDGVENSPNRPYGIHAIGCRTITVQNLTLRSSAFWMQRYHTCDGIHLHGLTIWNHANKNNDGIDIDSSQNVLISDCQLDTSDDAICFKSEGEAICGNAVVTNCLISTHASAIKLGTGSVGGFENITVSNLVIRRSASTVMKHPNGQWGGITGLDLCTVDGGPLRRIVMNNITMEGLLCPILMRHGNRLSGTVARQGYGGDGDHTQGVNADSGTGAQVGESRCYEDVVLSNIIARDMGPFPVIAVGYPEAPLRRISLRDITVHHANAATEQSAFLPTHFNDGGYPGPGMFEGSHLPAHGLFTRHTEDLVCENFRASAAEGDARPVRYDDKTIS
jgi:polygalacturonase